MLWQVFTAMIGSRVDFGDAEYHDAVAGMGACILRDVEECFVEDPFAVGQER
jgi:hypothetical protein